MNEDVVKFFIDFLNNNPDIGNPVANAVKEYFNSRKLDWGNKGLRFKVARLFFAEKTNIAENLAHLKKIGLLTGRKTYN